MFARSICRSVFVDKGWTVITKVHPVTLAYPLKHILPTSHLRARPFSSIKSLTKSCASSRHATHPLPHSRRQSTTTKAAKPLSIILTIVCPDRSGIVHSVTGWLASQSFNIRESAQYSDPATSKFFMRVHADAEGPTSAPDLAALRTHFKDELGARMDMTFDLTDEASKPRTMIMVSKIGHCIHDLLYRVSTGTLPIEVPLVVSNHPTFEKLCKSYDIPFYHLPISPSDGQTKEWQEERLMELVKEHNIDLVVLARYMQILSPKLCQVMEGRIINIHHSFLPSFKGAKPYHQAHTRGVKLIGATAHLVTSDLDEGPLIAQDVVRVSHAHTPAQMAQLGAEVEERVLASAVQWTAERRVLMNGTKTVIFN